MVLDTSPPAPIVALAQPDIHVHEGFLSYGPEDGTGTGVGLGAIKLGLITSQWTPATVIAVTAIILTQSLKFPDPDLQYINLLILFLLKSSHFSYENQLNLLQTVVSQGIDWSILNFDLQRHRPR